MMTNLPKDIARKWAERLENGTLTQGEGTLRDADNNYCCLGVLGDVLTEEGILVCKVQGKTPFDSSNYGYADPNEDLSNYPEDNNDPTWYTDYLPYELFSNLNDEVQGKYAAWNDEEGLSFNQIAQHVRSEFL